ncbi:hypothetical protein BZG36_05750 [Bifiguratus adelaidae]|uniref:Purple acid phosphatase n=1 Tax=Bifiguratus adelaidae TaxID=1938954 RepID=A0A261XST0_9FUNG|nr:hypothetical protein BZG36_05750 [Bifiguratus adelaidae]
MKLFVSAVLLVAAASAAHVPGSVPSNLYEPLEHRLAYAGPRGMTVSWNTFAKIDKPLVKYSQNPHKLTQDAKGNSVIYPTSRTWNHHVTLQDLKPNTKYYYTVTGENCHECPENEVYSFSTSLPAGDKTPYSIAVVVDLGLMGPQGLSTKVGTGAANPLGPNDTNTIQSLVQNIDSYDFLWHTGDIAYADYWLKEEIQGYLSNTTLTGGAELYETMLESFYDEMQPISSVKPYMVGPGNHEANCDNGGTTDPVHNITYTYDICLPGQLNFTGYINHFRMPSKESNGVGNFWYSWDHGLVHYIQLDTETDLGNGILAPDAPGGPEDENSGPFGSYPNEQVDWLAKDLASVDRSVTPWIVVGAHRPWYASYANKSSAICTVCKNAFEPLLNKYEVDLVMHGHIHFYERNAPMKNGVVDPNELNNPSSPWYIVNGAAGHYDGLDPLQYPIQNYSRYTTDQAYGWSRITVHNATHLTQEFVASRNNTVLDSATLYKEHNFKSKGHSKGYRGQH